MRKLNVEFADHLKHGTNIRKVGKPVPGHASVKRKLKLGVSSMLPPLNQHSKHD